MTIFLGLLLVFVIHYVILSSQKWWQYALSVLLALVLLGMMMLSHWDWHPSW